IKKISAFKHSKLANLIKPSGYYNQKAKRLRSFAIYFKNKYNSNVSGFFNRPKDVVRNELLSLSGIGPETADSMLLYAGGQLTFVVDAYTRRLGKRLGWFKTEDYNLVKRYFEKTLDKSISIYNEFHALIVRLAKEHCKAKPDCGECPINEHCSFNIILRSRQKKR
ncbi:endonuclease III domain-containing protein, partial [Elusimicrobiota bacterium]